MISLARSIASRCVGVATNAVHQSSGTAGSTGTRFVLRWLPDSPVGTSPCEHAVKPSAPDDRFEYHDLELSDDPNGDDRARLGLASDAPRLYVDSRRRLGASAQGPCPKRDRTA